MPIYEYEITSGPRKGEKVEVIQKFDDEPLTVLPDTGEEVEKVLSIPSQPQFKGKGFYCTDYKKPSQTKKTDR
jgi:predicted nucleic acid-binding Zn ribbon protein